MNKIIKLIITILIIGSGQKTIAFDIIQPIPENIKINKQKAYIGKLLFHDPILSKDKKVSCFSCHDIYNKCGTDHKKFSTGIFNRKGTANSITVLNSVFNFRQFWNGRAKDLQEQILFVLQNENEMGISKEEAIKRLNSNRLYKSLFKKVYKKDKITIDMITEVIAEFEKTLITPNSKFDLYLKGKVKLTDEEFKGYKLFKMYGCITCHNGVNFGGNSFQKFGAIVPVEWKPYYPDRYQITKKEKDKNVYKVPTLRNIECTYPYFHNGKIKTLKEAIKIMAYHNLGINLSKKEIILIEEFLKTLTAKPLILKLDLNDEIK